MDSYSTLQNQPFFVKSWLKKPDKLQKACPAHLLNSAFLFKYLRQRTLERLVRLCADNRIAIIDHIGRDTCDTNFLCVPNLSRYFGGVLAAIHKGLHVVC